MKRVFLILLPLLTVLTACGLTKQSAPDYIFLFTLDTMRADYIDYSLENNTLTPNFARLAAEGFYFENAFALAPVTLPSHAAMFYSLPPHRLKIYNNGQVQKISRPSVTQLLKGKDYATGAVVSLGVLEADFGLDKGFDRYIDDFKPFLWTKPAEEVNRDAMDMIDKIEKEKKGADKKSFFWIHYSDPHEPYFPPSNDGDFTISLNGNILYTCRSTEQPAVKTELQLEPGKNTLVLDTGIPAVFGDFKDCTVDYIKYREFSIQAPQQDQVELIPPSHWTSKKEKQYMNYYSDKTRSQLTIVNKSKEALTVQLAFHYSLHVSKAAGKQFYKEEVRYMDRCFGQLIAFLKERGIYERSAFIVMGDHGEGLGEYRGHFGHIHYLNNVFSRVPLIVTGAGVKQRGKRLEPVSNLHIAPTLLHLAGIKKPQYMLGESLLGKNLTTKKILLETYSPEAYFDAFSLIDFPWQIIFYPGRKEEKLEFYNLKNDPAGTVNLNNINNITDDINTDEMKKTKTELINSILRISRIITATKGKIGKSSQRHQEILKSLGYL
jgi:arylsulfatase A-like enzyme